MDKQPEHLRASDAYAESSAFGLKAHVSRELIVFTRRSPDRMDSSNYLNSAF
jgi:hypothetical protein